MALKVPICTFDARSGILCARCESKLKVGQISQADVTASKAFVQLAERIGELNRITLHRAIEVSGDYVLEVDEQDIPILRSNSDLLSELGRAMHGRVWVVAANTQERRFLDDLFYPIRILTVNTVWMPDGTKISKVIVTGRKGDRYLSDLQRMRNVVKRVRGLDLIIETEREAMIRT